MARIAMVIGRCCSAVVMTQSLPVMPGRAEGANPESILHSSGYGFRVRSLRERPGMTAVGDRQSYQAAASLRSMRRWRKPITALRILAMNLSQPVGLVISEAR